MHLLLNIRVNSCLFACVMGCLAWSGLVVLLRGQTLCNISFSMVWSNFAHPPRNRVHLQEICCRLFCFWIFSGSVSPFYPKRCNISLAKLEKTALGWGMVGAMKSDRLAPGRPGMSTTTTSPAEGCPDIFTDDFSSWSSMADKKWESFPSKSSRNKWMLPPNIVISQTKHMFSWDRAWD